MLMRAPRESGSWTWMLDDMPGPELEFALTTAARMSVVLAKHELLELNSVEWHWSHIGGEGAAGHSRLAVHASSLADPALPDRIRRELEQVLGAAAEPGEPTYYGRAVGHGLADPDIIDGLGPDVTHATRG
ncbi:MULTISPECIES: hypothetical protein [unclassified Streptomyces]|uniref:hypothetical protein n=1 Tax=unclassified Streptomyces TaxID=2593676 RepID=UPI0006AF6038|nr:MULTISPECIES: hypothetical protein [unclassified Streptomyces]KOU26721.1 hypothetical protein ADK49_03070 [Streptomyces sp. WM6349]KOV52442.1 hypothetical protein ADK98_06415 [Streptomyces sp. H036]